mmetsp:Transcript_96006/g.298461  ORF Transcript_96006/g.298461 Transcript_96006/m.298461 type:complete len:210 (+) Transcript_96006:35-664(+)
MAPWGGTRHEAPLPDEMAGRSAQPPRWCTGPTRRSQSAAPHAVLGLALLAALLPVAGRPRLWALPPDGASVAVEAETTVKGTDAIKQARSRLEQQANSANEGNCLLLCASCGAAIAALRFCEGSSRHFNPHGYLFHVGQFSRASGARAEGEASEEHTFFPGYAWRMGHCRSCGSFVGWRYESVAGSSTFWGLLWSRLVKARRPGPGAQG